MNAFLRTLLVVPSLLLVASCGGGGGGGGGTPSGGGYGTTNSAPTITNTSMNVSVKENQTAAFTVTASDVDGDALTYSISGTDSALFNITTAGVITFKAAPDFEAPADGNADNTYILVAQVSDGSLSATGNFTVAVTNDTSDDEVASAWDGTLLKNTTYAPYDKHAESYALILAGKN